MKTKLRHLLPAALCAASAAFAQGPLTPPGAPAPTMKSLQEIWDRIGIVEAQNAMLQSTVSAQQATLRQQRFLTGELAQINGVAPPWKTEQALAFQPFVPGGNVDWNSLALAPDDEPGVAYHWGTLFFAARANGVWQTTNVDATAANVGEYCSLEYSPSTHQPAIAYYDTTNGNLKFAEFNGASWALSVVESTGDVGKSCRLLFLPNGNPAIAYYDVTRTYLRYAERVAGVWQAEDVLLTARPELATTPLSAGINSAGRMGIAFISFGSPYFLRYVEKNNAGSWEAEQVATSSGFSQYSLAYNSLGQACVVFGSDSQVDLVRALRSSGTWSSALLMGLSPGTSSFRFDPLDRIAIGAGGGGDGARFWLFSGTGFFIRSEAIPSITNTSLSFNLRITSDGQPVVSFTQAGGVSFSKRQLLP